MDWVVTAMQQKPNNHWRLFGDRGSQKRRLFPGDSDRTRKVDHPGPQSPRKRQIFPILGIPRPFRPRNALGPRYLCLFTQLCENAKARNAIKEQLADKARDRLVAQGKMNNTEGVLERAINGNCLRFENEVEEWQEEINDARNAGDTLDADIVALKVRLESLEEQRKILWGKIYLNAQEYLNCCLDVNFEAEWSLSQLKCFSTRRLLDNHKLLRRRKHELIRLRYAPTGVIPLDSDPQDRSKICAIDRLTRIVELSTQYLEQSEEDWTADMTVQLSKAGRLECPVCRSSTERTHDSNSEHVSHAHTVQKGPPTHDVPLPVDTSHGLSPGSCRSRPGSGSSGPHGDGNNVISDADDSNAVEEQRANSREDSNHSDEEEHHSEKAQASAIERYYKWRDELETWQDLLKKFAALKDDQKVRHLLTFTNSNPERYDAYVKQLREPWEESVREAELELFTAEDDLKRLGLEVPRTPEPLDHRPLGAGHNDGEQADDEEAAGENRDDPANAERRQRAHLLKQRAINRERFRTAREGRDSATIRKPTPPSSAKRLEMLRDFSKPSDPLSDEVYPESSGRKRKREEWARRQEELYDEFAKPTTEKRRRRDRKSS